MRSAFLLVPCLLGVLLLGGGAPRWTHAMSSPSLIPDARLVREATRPFANLATDLYWVKTIAVATTAKQPWEARAIIEWADFVTDLEPTFTHAYFVGGLLGAVVLPDGSLANAKEAGALLAKGSKHLPRECRIAVYRSYLLIETHRPASEAAEVLAAVSREPGNNCPPYVAPLAIRLYAGSGHFDAADTFTRTLVAETRGDEQELFRKRLQDLEVERALQRIDAAYREYSTRFGAPPTDVATLVGAGLLDAANLAALDEPVVFFKGEARLASGAPRLKPFVQREPSQ